MQSFQKRPFRTFISHAHSNKGVVDTIHHWLTDVARIKAWYDTINFQASGGVASVLGDAILQCQSVILILSRDSVESGWVKLEYDLAMTQHAKYKQFSVIPILIEDCDVPEFLQSVKWIDLRNRGFDLSAALEILKSFYYDDRFDDLTKTQDIYVSRSWRSDATDADKICQMLDKSGFRLIGDDEDQREFDARRVKDIIAGCGGLVAILPERGGSLTSKYALQEIEIAQQLNLPYLIFTTANIHISESLISTALGVIVKDANTNKFDQAAMDRSIHSLLDEWKPPSVQYYSFLARSITNDTQSVNKTLREFAEFITAMPCTVGDNIRYGQIQQAIREQIAHAAFVVADISDEDINSWNVNSCIEAGVALGAGRKLDLLAKGPRRRAPFMISDQQITHYADDLELLGYFHHLIRPYRKHILNYEI